MAIKIKNLRISPYEQKNEVKVVFGDELKLTFEIPHVDGESYLCALDNERILYPINRPVCAYTEVFTRDGDDVSFTLNLTTSKLRDYVSSIKKPMPVWLQIVRKVNGKYETVLLDDILAIPSVIDGSMTVYEGDSFKELLDAKMNVPEAEGTDGQVLTMDADGHYSWQDLPIQEQVQSDWDESDSESPAYIKNKPESTVVNDGKITVNQGGVKKGEFTVNQAGDTTIDLNDGAQSDWDESDSSNVSFIKNKPTLFSGDYNDLTNKPNLATVATSGSYNDLTDKPIITQPVNADWDESDSENLAYIFNKPTIPAAQVQADWDESDSSDVSFILNKPDLSTKLDAPAVAGTVGQVLKKTATGQEWADDVDEDTLDALDDTITMFTSIVGELSDKNYFHITALESSSVTFRGCDYSNGNKFEYSYDRREWFKANLPLTVSLATGEILWLRNAEEPNGWDFVNSSILSGVGGVSVGGKLLSLASKSIDSTKVFTQGGRRLHDLFANYTALKAIEPDLNLSINSFVGNFFGAFQNTGLTNIPNNFAFPEGVTTVERLFYDCSSLTTVGAGFVVPNAVTNTTYLFRDCNNLTTIGEGFTIPSNVTSVSDMLYCQNITTIGNNVSINPGTNDEGSLFKNNITSIGTGFDYMSSYTTSSSSGQAVFPNATIGSGWKIYQYSDL